LKSTETGKRTVFANGSLASYDITNLKRSARANIAISLKFPISSDREQLEDFRQRISEWVDARPHEWIKVDSFRLERIEAHLQVRCVGNKQVVVPETNPPLFDCISPCIFQMCDSFHVLLQYMECVLTAQHRESWQKLDAIHESKSEILMFALELQRELKLAGG
jgi:Mechanosensitive ion channel